MLSPLLDQFHLRCLRRIAGVKWQDRVPNTDVLRTCQMPGIEALLLQVQFRWVEHVVRMPDNRIPKQIFFGQLASGKRLQGGRVRRYKDALKLNLKQCSIRPESLSSAPLNCSAWRSQYREAIDKFEETHVAALEHKLAVRKNSASLCTAAGACPCDRCHKICQSRIGLYAHQCTHR